MTRHPPLVLCQKTRGNLRSKERENSALFFVKGREETEVNKKGREETEVNKRENNALFFVKGGKETEVNKKRK